MSEREILRMKRLLVLALLSCVTIACNAALTAQGNSPQYAITFGGAGASSLVNYENRTFTQIDLPGQRKVHKPGSVTIVAGASMSPRFYQWLGNALANNEEGGPIA